MEHIQMSVNILEKFNRKPIQRMYGYRLLLNDVAECVTVIVWTVKIYKSEYIVTVGCM